MKKDKFLTKKNGSILLLALIPGILFGIYTFLPEISQAIKNSEEVNIVPMYSLQLHNFKEKLDNFQKFNLYIPNYDAEIYITPKNRVMEIGEELKFTIFIEDKGIVPLEKANLFFYTFLENPNGDIVASFPKINVPYNDDELKYPRNTYGDTQWNYDFFFNNSLIDEYTVEYTYVLNQPGTWRIRVFLLQTEYKDRDGDTLSSDYKENILEYGENVVDVYGKEQIPPLERYEILIKLIYFVVFSVIPFLTIFFTLRKYYNKVLELYNEIKPLLYVYLVFLIVTLVFVFIILKLTCYG